MNKLDYCKDEIKAIVDCRDVFRNAGVELDRADFCLCPFHGEKTPSCKVYEKGFKCFGCGESGDMIFAVQKLYNLDFRQALERINTEFRLNLPLGQTELTREQRAHIAVRKVLAERKKRRIAELERQYDKTGEEFKKAHFTTLRDKPKLSGGEMIVSDNYARAVFLLPLLEYKLEMIGGEIREEKNHTGKRDN